MTKKGYAVPADYMTFPAEESPRGIPPGGNVMRERQSLSHVKWDQTGIKRGSNAPALVL